MKLYLLTRRSERPVYDVCNGFVVRAHDENDARGLASDQKGDEGASTWLDPDLSTCVEIHDTGERGVVLVDYNAG